MNLSWPDNSNAAVTLTFDDGFAATCRAAVPILHQRGLCATFNVITSQVGTTFEGLPTAGWDEWKEAALLGHEIGSHGFDHSPLAGHISTIMRLMHNIHNAPNLKQYLRQLRLVSKNLTRWKNNNPSDASHQKGNRNITNLRASRLHIDQNIGAGVAETFAYPSGQYDAAARSAVEQAGFSSARSLAMGVNDLSQNRFALQAVQWTPGMTVQDLVWWREQACRMEGWLILVFHLVASENPAGYPYFCDTVEWHHLLDTLQEKPVWIATQRDVIHHLNSRAANG